MRSVNEQKIVDAFLKEYNANGGNSIWASETIDYRVFVEHYYEFNALPEEEQWEIRNLLGAIAKLYR